MRPHPLSLVVGAIVLLAAAVSLVVVDHSHRSSELARERGTLDRSLLNEVTAQTAHVESQFAKARSTLLLTVRNPAFADFYRVSGGTPVSYAHTPAQRRAAARVETGLGYLARLFPGSIGEACFVHRDGLELARAVQGRPVGHVHLIADKSDRAFFKPAFAHRAVGNVHQARPTLSKDTNDWTIPHATVVPGTDRRTIVHFDMTIESFRRAMALGARDRGLRSRIFDRGTGTILIDSRSAQRKGGLLGQNADPAMDPLAGTTARGGLRNLAGQRVAFRAVDGGEANANDWVLAVSAPAIAGAVRVNPLFVGLAAFALLALVAALLLVRRRQGQLHLEAATDSLTGLPNRRALAVDLDRHLERAGNPPPAVFAMFDLDGFKAYNDTFGHPSGDALLERLGGNLDKQLPDGFRAYRLGGDEFCVFGVLDGWDADVVLRYASEALTEEGNGFRVGASVGSVVIPEEAATRTHAMLLADQRMYANKDSRRPSLAGQARDLLLTILQEREPDLHEHVRDVAVLSRAVGHRLGLDAEELDELVRAAELHDIGKMAVPDSILNKPAALDEKEWSFMRRHTVIGERILSASPAMLPVARIVRASHERWDGNGYPDRLAGEQIPLPARIVFACDAFNAITSVRPYSTGSSVAEALAELQRCAGTQFDPTVVEALCEAVHALAAGHTSSPAPRVAQT